MSWGIRDVSRPHPADSESHGFQPLTAKGQISGNRCQPGMVSPPEPPRISRQVSRRSACLPKAPTGNRQTRIDSTAVPNGRLPALDAGTVRQLARLLVVCLPALAGPRDLWTPQPVLTNAPWVDGIFASWRFIVSLAQQNGAASNRVILVSDDGAKWMRTREGQASKFTKGNGLIVAVVGGPAVISSANGENWIAKRLPVPWGIQSWVFGLGRFWIYRF
jgi:hypothetical protein